MHVHGVMPVTRRKVSPFLERVVHSLQRRLRNEPMLRVDFQSPDGQEPEDSILALPR